MNTEKNILFQRILFTVLILMVYLTGRNLPLYGIDFTAFQGEVMDVEQLFRQTIGGDLYQRSLFALGIAPYMTASILVQMSSAFKSSEQKKCMSRIKKNRTAVELMLLFAIIQAILRTQKLEYAVDGNWVFFAQIINTIELVAGAFFILWLCDKNTRFGVGGQTILILVNIIDGIRNTLSAATVETAFLPVIFGLVAVVLTLLMEFTGKRIGVQRISIHNTYADKSFLEIKTNPIGIMPVMFSMAFYMIPQYFISAQILLFGEDEILLWWKSQLVVTKPIGIVFYILVLYLLTFLFSRIMLNPGELTEQMQKNGDSLVLLHPGKETKRYLSGVITRHALFGATVMSACMAVPFVLSYQGKIDPLLMMLPASFMMLSGMACNIGQEIRATKHSDSYSELF